MSGTQASVFSFQQKIEQLLVTRHCSGTYNLEPGKARLFYSNKSGDKVGFIDFASPNGVDNTQLEDLVSVCEPAKFGRGNEDVLDESYRKAWKLDASRFATQLDIASSGILSTVREALLQYGNSRHTLEAHLDKMNVYGPGSFFKPHVDTPRDRDMLATLVIVLPTEHEGGDLLLGEEKWQFNSAEMVSKSENSLATDGIEVTMHRLAFAAFYSDIEHEVTPVKSGYRVTVTYNLYCRKGQDPLSSRARIDIALSPAEVTLIAAMKAFLSRPEILPSGGIVGFGLTHFYPIEPKADEDVDRAFEGVLKGGDALIERVCQYLGYKVKVKALYGYEEGNMGSSDTPSVRRMDSYHSMYLTNRYTSSMDEYAERVDQENAEEDWKAYWLETGAQVKSLTDTGRSSRRKAVLWLTRPNWLMASKTAYMAYGNEASMGYVYGSLVLTVEVPDAKTRLGNGEEEGENGDEGQADDSSESEEDY
ncbi:hypothetical protein CC1G_00063 [Coprinopsis cinerea okayama7|uniref:Fe2OG dioxygenase domain-containing protein n=1 Tax=Coprinopsis cinerea (strain Okayama-7 / 130 / ATCC MYA-4618 / FGSC 9003) TaxID=240176 RepID=A8NWL8_COPC7|nr:hypothetical protein CC1G_00063 [Coprinopsis cinerea okayama7\|eukprot:XP_001836927.1 hypothetical protein CC1G_00063 [Coprinopsis cinerea okayama7\